MQEVLIESNKQQEEWEELDCNTKILLNMMHRWESWESCLSVKGYYNSEQQTVKREHLKERKSSSGSDDITQEKSNQNDLARTKHKIDPNERCIYIFVRGLRLGYQCTRPAMMGKFCHRCSHKPYRHKNNILNKTPLPDKPKTIVKDRPTELKPTGESLRNLCKRLSSEDILEEARNRCNETHNQDISYGLLGAAKYISHFEYVEPVDGTECGIVIMDKHMVSSHNRMFTSPLYTIRNWKSLSSYRITKTSQVTDLEGLITILWQLTYKGWPKDYYEWLGMDGVCCKTLKENVEKHIEYVQKIKEKTGLK